MISLEEENRLLKQNKTIKQSTYSDYSAGDLGRSSQVPDKFDETDQQFREMQKESSSSLSKKSFSSEAKSPQNSVQSVKPTESGSDTFSNFRALETIPENTDEYSSMNRTRERGKFNDFVEQKTSDIHSSLPISQNKGDELMKQPKFMFNSLQKGRQPPEVPSFPTPEEARKVGLKGSQEAFLFRTGETGANFNPFRKADHELDIEIESENSRMTSSRDGKSNLLRSFKRNPDEVKLTRWSEKFFWKTQTIFSTSCRTIPPFFKNCQFFPIISCFQDTQNC